MSASAASTFPRTSAPPHTLVVLLCGLPGAGKSTLAAGLKAAVTAPTATREGGTRPATAVLLVEIDEAGPPAADEEAWSRAAWQASKAASLARVSDALRRAPDPSGGRRLIVVDDNFWSRSQRKPYYALAREAGASLMIVHVVVPLDEALRRNRLRTPARMVPEGIIRDMAVRYEGLTDGAPASGGARSLLRRGGGWDTRLAVVLPAEAPAAAAVEHLAALITAEGWDAERVPTTPAAVVASAEVAAAATAATLLHAADLVLRTLVSRTISAAPSPASAAAPANAARRRVLEVLRRLTSVVRAEDDDDDDGAAAAEMASVDHCVGPGVDVDGGDGDASGGALVSRLAQALAADAAARVPEGSARGDVQRRTEPLPVPSDRSTAARWSSMERVLLPIFSSALKECANPWLPPTSTHG